MCREMVHQEACVSVQLKGSGRKVHGVGTKEIFLQTIAFPQ